MFWFKYKRVNSFVLSSLSTAEDLVFNITAHRTDLVAELKYVKRLDAFIVILYRERKAIRRERKNR